MRATGRVSTAQKAVPDNMRALGYLVVGEHLAIEAITAISTWRRKRALQGLGGAQMELRVIERACAEQGGTTRTRRLVEWATGLQQPAAVLGASDFGQRANNCKSWIA